MRLVVRSGASLALLLTAGAATAGAQSCLGLPGVTRLAAFTGFEGTDGSSGFSVGVAGRNDRFSIQLQRKQMGAWALADDVVTYETQGSYALRPGATVCVVAATNRMSYDVETIQRVQYEPGPNGSTKITEHRLSEGAYSRLRLPVGVSLGTELWRGRAVTLTPFVAPSVVLDYERFERESYSGGSAGTDTRTQLGVGGSAGFTLGTGPALLRTSVTHAFMRDRHTLAGKHNWAFLAVQLGLRF